MFSNSTIAILFFNLWIYLITLSCFFLILFSFNVKALKTTNDFKNLMQTTFFINCLVFLFLTLAGLPPFLNFVGKFLIFIIFFQKTNFLLLTIFLLFNSFVLYFYLQHLKLIFFKKRSTYFDFKNNKLNFGFNVVFLLILFLFFLTFGLLFYNNIFIFFYIYLFA